MKRIALFLATNIAVLLVASIVLNLLGVDAYMASRGQNLGGLIVFAAVFGFAGSFISLAMSKWVAKRGTGAQVIEQPRNEMEAWLLQTVQRQAQMAGIKCPEVAIYDAPEINAFATGPSTTSDLVQGRCVWEGQRNWHSKRPPECDKGETVRRKCHCQAAPAPGTQASQLCSRTWAGRATRGTLRHPTA